MIEFPNECPRCKIDLDLDYNYEGEYIVGYLICPNPKCPIDYKVEYSRVHINDAEEDCNEDDNQLEGDEYFDDDQE